MMEVVVAPEASFFVFIHKGLNRRTAVPEAAVRNLSFKTPSFYHGVGCNSANGYIGRTCRSSQPVHALVSEDVGVSSSRIGDFRVITTSTDDSTVMKVNVEVSGTKTRAIFDDVFDRMVEAAQPIPGFRRVKGGKTPNIPRDILLEILGASRVYKEVIKKVINSAMAEYVDKEGLKVGKDLRVEQSFEDLEEAFSPGEKFSFDAVLRLQSGAD
ncbi:unnamed protein product [Linum trigynum]|uniref:peptidylprolyl isomerase n=1 Tax=Linum trigynum TaxID=586398 RepID=A0AAV2G0M0_9ROSI